MFKTKSNYDTHLMTHTQWKPIRCPESECSHRARTQQQIDRHVKSKHRQQAAAVGQAAAVDDQETNESSDESYVPSEASPMSIDYDTDDPMDIDPAIPAVPAPTQPSSTSSSSATSSSAAGPFSGPSLAPAPAAAQPFCSGWCIIPSRPCPS